MEKLKEYRKVIFVLELLIITMVFISACLGNGDKATGLYSAPTLTTTTVAMDQPVYIVSQKLGNASSGDVSVSGIIKSNMKSPLTAWVTVELTDKNNKTIGTGETIIRLDMQGMSNFEVVIVNSAKYAHDEGMTYRCYVNRISY